MTQEKVFSCKTCCNLFLCVQLSKMDLCAVQQPDYHDAGLTCQAPFLFGLVAPPQH